MSKCVFLHSPEGCRGRVALYDRTDARGSTDRVWYCEEGARTACADGFRLQEVAEDGTGPSLSFRTREACEQLQRYSGRVFCEQLVELVELLADLNDDLWHARAQALIDERIDAAKARLETLRNESRKSHGRKTNAP